MGTLLVAARDRLQAAGIADAELEVASLRRWAQEAVDWKPRFQEAVTLRTQRVPFSHIVGRREFWKQEFIVTPAVLDPRPESETVIECAVRTVAETLTERPELRILDLGTGSGCLLISLLNELPAATGVGIDCSPAAVAVAERNVRRAQLDGRTTIICSDWLRGVEDCYDVVVCNPPYIASHEFATLAPEVAVAEPRLALDGGVDGLRDYRSIASDLGGTLRPGGFACFEFGAGQVDAVRHIFERVKLQADAVWHDMDGRERCVIVRHPPAESI